MVQANVDWSTPKMETRSTFLDDHLDRSVDRTLVQHRTGHRNSSLNVLGFAEIDEFTRKWRDF